MELLIFAGIIYLALSHKDNSGKTKSNFKDWRDLKAFSESRGFFVTSTTGGAHNKNSKHYQGNAVDVRTRDKANAQIEKFIIDARNAGIKVIDERQRPKGQKVWSGAHLHLEI